MDDFVLFRIIGNDLPPRHRAGQSVDNVRFILENEPELPGCAKRWIVNRIVEPEVEYDVLALLDSFEQDYLRIPFDPAEYARLDWDLDCFPDPGLFLSEAFDELEPWVQRAAEHRARTTKICYAMNVNGARNLALREGRRSARWILPWDGNCFLTTAAWAVITGSIAEHPAVRHVVVPMVRLRSNDELSDHDLVRYATEEPQIILRHDAAVEFDERYPYGWRNKTDLLRRLGVPGFWDRNASLPWDLPEEPLSPEAGCYLRAGWVARLASGHPEQERGQGSMMRRGIARQTAIFAMTDELDRTILETGVAIDGEARHRHPRTVAVRSGLPE